MKEHLFLVIILFLSSCTITKRVHRRGVTIEWHKKYSTIGHLNKNSSKKKELELSFSDEVKGSTCDSVELGIGIYFVEEKQNIEPIHYSFSNTKRTEVVPKKEVIHELETRGHIVQFDESVKKSKTYSANAVLGSDELFKTIGVVLLILGGIIILTSFIALSGFIGFENLFSSLVLSGNGIAASFLGFLLFLLLLVLFILFLLLIEAIGGFIVGLTLGLVLLGVGGILLLVNQLLN